MRRSCRSRAGNQYYRRRSICTVSSCSIRSARRFGDRCAEEISLHAYLRSPFDYGRSGSFGAVSRRTFCFLHEKSRNHAGDPRGPYQFISTARRCLRLHRGHDRSIPLETASRKHSRLEPCEELFGRIECIACRNRAVIQALSEPVHSLLRTSVGKRFRTNMTRCHLL